jgi:hypothetical protein
MRNKNINAGKIFVTASDSRTSNPFLKNMTQNEII